MAPGSENRRLDPLADLLRAFVRRARIRAFAVEVPAADQPDVDRLVLGFEHHADNRSPFFPARVSKAACAGDAWSEAAQAFHERHTELRSAGAPVGSLPPAEVGGEPGARASVLLAGIAAEVQAPADGILVHLAMTGDPDPALLEQLATMVRSRDLDGVRFVVSANAQARLDAWAAKLGEDRAWFYRLEPAPETEAVQTAQALDAESEHGPGFRGAWPSGTTPPPRPRRTGVVRATEPDPVDPTIVSDSETDTPPDPDFEHSLSVLIRQAEAEMQQERGPEALRLQTQARELCTEHGEHVRAVEMEMMLGGYLMKLQQPRLAAATFVRADESGYEHQAYDLASRARLNEGVAHEADGDIPAAIRAYRRAIETGKGIGESPHIVFDAYRRAGEAALREGLDVDCIGLWADAVAYGREVEPEQRTDTLKELAQRLSTLLVQHRRYSQARDIDRIAEQF